MKYLLLLYGDERVWEQSNPQEQADWLEAHRVFTRAVQEQATLLGGEALATADTASTLAPAADGARRVVTDGPFAETVEQIGGFYLVAAADLDHVIDLCHLLPAWYRVEIRPVVEVDH